MKQYLFVVICVVSFLLYGCSNAGKNAKVQDLEYTIVEEGNIPAELMKIINEKKAGEFKLTFSNEQFLYLVVGYGTQPTGGYSIQVPNLYLTDNNIVLDTNLVGPEGEAITRESTPFIVIKLEYRSEPVLFE